MHNQANQRTSVAANSAPPLQPLLAALGSNQIMDQIQRLVEKIKSNGHDLWIGEAANSESISSLQRELEVNLPESLMSFLASYGGLGIYDNFVSGINNNQPLSEESGGIYGDTLLLREEYDLPNGLWVISLHEDGAYCLDARQTIENSDYPIVNFEFGVINKAANSFSEFLTEWFLKGWANDTA